MALLSWILISTTIAVSSAVTPNIFQNARCQAFCITQYPEPVVAGSLQYLACNKTECKECVQPCSREFVSFEACNTSCSGSSACEKSCDFLNSTLLGNVPYESNISSPGVPIAVGKNFSAIELSWSPPANTAAKGVVYIVRMSYGGDLSSNGWITLNQVFLTPEAVVSDFYLCRNITGFYDTVSGPRETYNGIYYKFQVIAVSQNGAPIAGNLTDEIRLPRPAAPGDVNFNLVQYGPLGFGEEELQFQGTWTAPAAHAGEISRYFITWNGSNCYSPPRNVRRYTTTNQQITFYLPYQQVQGCQNEFKVYTLVGCSVSLSATVIVENPGCRNISSFPPHLCCRIDPPAALGDGDLMVQNLTRGPLSLNGDCTFSFKISWDAPPYLERTGCEFLFDAYTYFYGKVPGNLIGGTTTNREVQFQGILPGNVFKFEIAADINAKVGPISRLNFTIPGSGPERSVQNLNLTLVTNSSGARYFVAEWKKPLYNSNCLSHYLLNYTFGDGTYMTAITNSTSFLLSVGNIAQPSNVTLTVTPIYNNPMLVGIASQASAFLPDLNECLTNNGGCNHTCVNTIGSFQCSCKTGFTLSVADNKTCSDINECLTNNGGCNRTCVNTEGSYMCMGCKDGYILSADNKTCLDINECATNNGGCNQICMNTQGSYKCLCNPGYMLSPDNQTCVDIDECLMNNGGCNHSCMNTVGSYKCLCKPGYMLQADNKTCLDINECLTNVGGCNQICNNTMGSYKCECLSGYKLAVDLRTCIDIDECATNNGGCSQYCYNFLGGYKCWCKNGYTLSTDGKTCTNPCTNRPHGYCFHDPNYKWVYYVCWYGQTYQKTCRRRRFYYYKRNGCCSYNGWHWRKKGGRGWKWFGRKGKMYG